MTDRSAFFDVQKFNRFVMNLFELMGDDAAFVDILNNQGYTSEQITQISKLYETQDIGNIWRNLVRGQGPEKIWFLIGPLNNYSYLHETFSNMIENGFIKIYVRQTGCNLVVYEHEVVSYVKHLIGGEYTSMTHALYHMIKYVGGYDTIYSIFADSVPKEDSDDDSKEVVDFSDTKGEIIMHRDFLEVGLVGILPVVRDVDGIDANCDIECHIVSQVDDITDIALVNKGFFKASVIEAKNRMDAKEIYKKSFMPVCNREYVLGLESYQRRPDEVYNLQFKPNASQYTPVSYHYLHDSGKIYGYVNVLMHNGIVRWILSHTSAPLYPLLYRDRRLGPFPNASEIYISLKYPSKRRIFFDTLINGHLTHRIIDAKVPYPSMVVKECSIFYAASQYAPQLYDIILAQWE